jgi:(p)ppGpp synthase/HD superfamily hydrolase
MNYEDYLKLRKEAEVFATKAHRASRYGDPPNAKPYSFHLDMVDEVLERFGFNPEKEEKPRFIRLGGRLHDTMEDGPVSYSDIKKKFGFEVAEIVYCVTDEVGRTRAEKKIKTYPKLRTNPDAIIVKVGDRITNVEYGIATENTDKYKMYRNEFPEFEQQLRIYRHIPEMWDHLRMLLKIEG